VALVDNGNIRAGLHKNDRFDESKWTEELLKRGEAELAPSELEWIKRGAEKKEDVPPVVQTEDTGRGSTRDPGVPESAVQPRSVSLSRPPGDHGARPVRPQPPDLPMPLERGHSLRDIARRLRGGKRGKD
jgi:hypothetical protein